MEEKELSIDEWKDLEKDMEEMSEIYNMSKSDLKFKALRQRDKIKELERELEFLEFLAKDIIHGFGSQRPIR